jgi:DeoR/GlpR family transcriptional regulator of sugar metabolism
MRTTLRREDVSDYIRRRRSASVTELAAALQVSAQTVRRDLEVLATDGVVRRVHGGAVALDEAAGEIAVVERARLQEHAKRRIGAAAAQLVAPGSTIFLSGGTTTERVAARLGDVAGVTVVTNALNIAFALRHAAQIGVIVLGGELRHSELTLLGRIAEEAIAQVHVSHAVFGCFGLDAEAGLTGASLAETSTDRAILETVERLTVLADHSKFQQRGPVRLAPVTRITTLVTDRHAPPADVARLEQQGVEVVLA